MYSIQNIAPITLKEGSYTKSSGLTVLRGTLMRLSTVIVIFRQSKASAYRMIFVSLRLLKYLTNMLLSSSSIEEVFDIKVS